MNRYFKTADTKNFVFYKVPKALFEEKYKSVSTDAKMLYGLLLDRMYLSITILSYPKFIIRSIRHLIYEYPFQIFAFTGYSFL